MYFNVENNPFFKPASTLADDYRFQLIKHFRSLAQNSRVEGMTFDGYVLYALLRGADIRKTSHMEDGDNALDALRDIQNQLRRHIERTERLEKPVMNFYVMKLIGTPRKERGRPVGLTHEMVLNDKSIEIDFVEIKRLVDEGITFYDSLNHSH